MFLKGLHFAAQEKAEGPWRSWRTKQNSHADNIFSFVSDRHHNQTSPNQKVTPTPVTALSVGTRWLSLFLSQITPTSLCFLQPSPSLPWPSFLLSPGPSWCVQTSASFSSYLSHPPSSTSFFCIFLKLYFPLSNTFFASYPPKRVTKKKMNEKLKTEI